MGVTSYLLTGMILQVWGVIIGHQPKHRTFLGGNSLELRTIYLHLDSRWSRQKSVIFHDPSCIYGGFFVRRMPLFNHPYSSSSPGWEAKGVPCETGHFLLWLPGWFITWKLWPNAKWYFTNLGLPWNFSEMSRNLNATFRVKTRVRSL